MNLHDLLEARAALWASTKAFLDTVEAEGRADSAEAKAEYDRRNADLSTFDARIAEAVELDKRNAAAEELRAKYAPKPDTAPPAVTDADVLRKMVGGELRAFDFNAAPESRDILKSGNASNTVPTSFYDRLVENMIVNAGMLQTNVTVLNTASGETLQIPKATAHPQASWLTEGGSITESDPTFAQASLSSYKLGFSTQISSELETDTAVNLMEYLARRGGEALGNGAGAAYVVGTGTGQPTGIAGATTLGVTGGTGVSGAFTADNLIDLYYSVIPAYRNRGYWMMNDSTLAVARKLKDGAGRYLFEVEGGLSNAPGVGTLLGKPVVTDPNVPVAALSAKSVIFGDFSAYYVRKVSGIRVERSVDFAFQNDLVTWRFLLRTDGKLIDTSGAVKHFVGAAS